MNKNYKITDSEIFGDLAPASLDLIIPKAKHQNAETGKIVFQQGDTGNALYIVTAGAIEISILSPAGKKLSLNVMRRGDVFGEIAALDGSVRTATATAVETSSMLVIARNEIIALLERHPKLSVDFIKVLCGRLRWVSAHVEHLALSNIEGRIAKRLLILHDKFCDHSASLKLSQSELAEFLGTTRETTNKTLNSWKSDGVIKLSRGSIRIVDRERLITLAKAG